MPQKTSVKMHKVYIGLGTNLYNKEENLKKTLELLSEFVGDIILCSSFYKSEPWGFTSKNNFLNAVVLIETKLAPENVLTQTQKIEKLLGRKRKSVKVYTDRIIDIDILLYDDLILDTPQLKIPHPHILERDFVLTPLAEISPEIVERGFGKYQK